MAYFRGPNIVTNGLVLHLDASNSKSYSGSGLTWSDLTINKNNGILINNTGFFSASSTDSVSYFSFTGSNKLSVNSFIPLQSQNVTIEIWVSGTHSAFDAVIEIGDSGGGTIIDQLTSRGDSGSPTPAIVTTCYYKKIDTTDTFAYVVQNGTPVYLGTFSQHVFYISSNGVSGGYHNGKVYVTNAIPASFSSWNLAYNSLYLNYKSKTNNVKVYNRVLSAAEVLQNYNALKSRYGLL